MTHADGWIDGPPPIDCCDRLWLITRLPIGRLQVEYGRRSEPEDVIYTDHGTISHEDDDYATYVVAYREAEIPEIPDRYKEAK